MKNLTIHLLIAAIIICSQISLQAQSIDSLQANNNQLLQFSGVVVEADSLSPIPYTSILVKNTSRGTISDYFGFFSFVAKPNDTLEFTAIGYRSSNFVVPDTLTSNTYSLIQVLTSDTILLQTVAIHPWPSKENFKQAFLNLEMADNDIAYANSNLNKSEKTSKMYGMASDASLNYKYASAQRQSRLYYAGQYPPNNLLNPVAWAKFIKAWKQGDLKR